MIDGGLAQQVGGIGLYGYWNQLLYGEVSLYRTNNTGITRPLGAGTTIDTYTDGIVPYYRLALQHSWNNHSVSIGAYGLIADIFPSSNTNGLTDRFTDTAFDTQYQFVGQKHIFTAQTTWVHERQDWNASFALGNTANSFNNLDSFKINCNYYYRTTIGTVGGTIRYFTISGSNDSLLYSPSPVSGSDSGNPDSRGFLFELDYLPTDYIKLAAQYIVYGKFNGGQSNYDGFGKNASDNNTFYLLVWLTY